MWRHTFEIPDHNAFSGSVQKAIDTGIVSAKARREINQTLRTLSLQHARYHTVHNFIVIATYLSTYNVPIYDICGDNFVKF